MGITEAEFEKLQDNLKRSASRKAVRLAVETFQPPIHLTGPLQVRKWRKSPGKPALARSAKADRTCNGQTFDSKAEMLRFKELEILQVTGVVDYFLRQPRFELLGCTYRADFQIFWRLERFPCTPNVTYEDVKGKGSPRFVVDRYRRSIKQVKTLYGVEIQTVYR